MCGHYKNGVMANKADNSLSNSKPVCGVIMPISALDGCSEEHWREVLSILEDAIKLANFEPNLVSDADDIGILQKRIVQNVYNNEVIVCDVSGKNSNVMFELGMRLAFDKPTIIIKDDMTNYSFDTSVIEHLEYPRDLRFTKIIAFKEKLRSKIAATYEKSKADPNYSTFLKSFGEYKVAQLQSKEVSSEAYILESLEELKNEVRVLRRTPTKSEVSKSLPPDVEECICVHVSEYVMEHDLSSLSEIKKHKTKIVNYLKSINHIEMTCGSKENVRPYLEIALEDTNLLKKYMPKHLLDSDGTQLTSIEDKPL
jgi:hypothetical protein